ncbi:unnamed protein product [Owenia fusiformis]|uniref:Uncharacterized protein n=1 Tax=Owenia fusiformis TaxID=6347 RepID=A0A8J1TC94_OWEFU|nr:unnamed protein product [Owenia fusiformis]
MKVIYRELSTSDKDIKISLDTNVELPKHDDTSVVVQVKACGLSNISNKVLNLLHSTTKSEQCLYSATFEVTGLVTQVGCSVTGIQPGDRVAGFCPLDSEMSACADFCVLKEHNIVKIPEGVEFEMAAACIGDCLKAYIALHYLARLCSGDTLLVIDGASSAGTMVIQLAQLWGAKVMATVSCAEERSFLETLQPPLAQIIDSGDKTRPISSSVLEETGGIGVDCVIDNGARLFTSEDDMIIAGETNKSPSCHKYDIISCLGVGGRWVTSQPDLQLDPLDSECLFLRSASVCFLFPESWLLSNSQQGRYQHILADIMDKLSQGLIKANITKTVNFDNTIDALQTLQNRQIGKTVMSL